MANAILAALPSDWLSTLGPHLAPASFAVSDEIESVGRPVDRIIFPDNGVFSLLAQAGEYELEVCIIGFDGMTGTSALLGDEKAIHRVICQARSTGWQVSIAGLNDVLRAEPSLLGCLLPYVARLIAQISQAALVNGRGVIEERLARWLLMMQDRVGSNELALTHPFLARMLGVHPPGMTLALQTLEGMGAIKNVPRLVSIRNREELAESIYHKI